MLLRSLASCFGHAASAIEAMVSAVMTAPCPICRDPLDRHRAGVCERCWKLAAETAAAGPSGRFVSSMIVLGPYEGRLGAIIRRLKFGGLPAVATPLGERLARRLLAWAPGVDLVVPVPLHRRRQWQRGYNQAERIASPIARALGRPLKAGALHRTRPTGPQTGRSRRDRIANVRGAFITKERKLAGMRILLVDDVVTTGATVRECARVLRAAGAGPIHVAAAARTVAQIQI